MGYFDDLELNSQALNEIQKHMSQPTPEGPSVTVKMSVKRAGDKEATTITFQGTRALELMRAYENLKMPGLEAQR